jgi:hypothetical protein
VCLLVFANKTLSQIKLNTPLRPTNTVIASMAVTIGGATIVVESIIPAVPTPTVTALHLHVRPVKMLIQC